MPTNFKVLIWALICVNLWAQDEGGDFARIRELAASRNWSGVIQASNAFTQRYPLSSFLPEVSYLSVVAKVEGGDLQAALTEIRRFYRLYPNSPFMSKLLHWEGSVHLQLRNYASAEEVLKRHLGSEPSGSLSALSWFYLGQAQENRRLFREAESSYDRAVRLGRDMPIVQEAVVARSRVLRQLGQGDRARSVLRDFLSRPEAEDDRLRLEYARVLLELGITEEGLSALKRLENAQEPIRSQAILLSVRVLMQNQRWKEALEASEGLSATTRQQPVFLLNAAEIHRQLGNIDAAREVWKRVMSAGNEAQRQMAAFNLALSYDTPTEGISLLEQAQRGPNIVIARDARWRLSFLGPTERQIKILKEIIDDEADSQRRLQAHRRLLVLGQETNDVSLMLESLNALIDSGDSTDLAQYLFLRARLRKDDEYDLALRDLQQIVQKERNTPLVAQAYYEIGNIYARRNEYARAEGFFHLSSQRASGELKELALLARGISLFNAQNFQLAQQVLSRLVQEHPQSDHRPQANYMRAMSLIKLEKETEARRLLMALVESEGNYAAEAAYEIGVLDSVQQPVQAKDFFLKAYRLELSNQEVRLNSLDAALGLMYRSGNIQEMTPYLRTNIWGNDVRARTRLEYWQTMVLAASNLDDALRRASLLLANYPRVFLEMEAAPFLSHPQRIRILDEASAKMTNEDEILQVSLRKMQLLRSSNDQERLQSEVKTWLSRWGGQATYRETARIVCRFVDSWENIFPMLEGADPAIRAEFLLFHARATFEQDPMTTRRNLQRILSERTDRNQKHEAQWLLGLITIIQGRAIEAKTLFQKLLDDNPISENRANFLLGLGLAERNLGNTQAALQDWDNATNEGNWDSSARAAFEAYTLLQSLGREDDSARYRILLQQRFPASHWTRRLD